MDFKKPTEVTRREEPTRSARAATLTINAVTVAVVIAIGVGVIGVVVLGLIALLRAVF